MRCDALMKQKMKRGTSAALLSKTDPSFPFSALWFRTGAKHFEP
jgi:hypothetical protein